ncbi:unnamed protein product, partial [Amoebophrya sp. A120]
AASDAQQAATRPYARQSSSSPARSPPSVFPSSPRRLTMSQRDPTYAMYHTNKAPSLSKLLHPRTTFDADGQTSPPQMRDPVTRDLLLVNQT